MHKLLLEQNCNVHIVQNSNFQSFSPNLLLFDGPPQLKIHAAIAGPAQPALPALHGLSLHGASRLFCFSLFLLCAARIHLSHASIAGIAAGCGSLLMIISLVIVLRKTSRRRSHSGSESFSASMSASISYLTKKRSSNKQPLLKDLGWINIRPSCAWF